MKITIALFIVGLVMSPAIGLAQTSDTQVLPSAANVVSSPTVVASPIPVKCGVNTFAVNDECGVNAFKNVYVQCYDGYETKLGATETSCKSSETWQQYAKEACTNHCSTGKEPNVISKPQPQHLPLPTPVLTPTPKPISVCYMSDNLMQEYSRLIAELQKSESDKARAEEITQKIVALKQEIEKQQKECANPQRPIPTATSQRPVPLVPPTVVENKPVAVSIDRCGEVAQWENKISYYKKLGGLTDVDLKKEGFSREDIDKILRDLSAGLEKVKAQCGVQTGTIATPPTVTTGSASIAETVKPVVVESGQEIGVYYKAKLEKAVSAKGEEKQIQELKTLRDEIDGLISNLIKSRKELEVSELNTLVKEVKVSRGEIKADEISVKTTEKKMLINVGDRPVSVEPTVSQVLIRDKGLEVNTTEVTIKENVLSVGGVDVKMSASEVTEKLGLTPKTIELKEENAKAVYSMKIGEQRKLFGFIPFNISKTVTADAGNGDVLGERLPWYRFFTTK